MRRMYQVQCIDKEDGCSSTTKIKADFFEVLRDGQLVLYSGRNLCAAYNAGNWQNIRNLGDDKKEKPNEAE